MKFSEFNVAVNTSQIDFIVGYKGLQNFRISPSDLVGTFSSLNYITDSGSGTIDLGTQAFSILGTTNEIETSGALQTLTIGFPASGVILPNGSEATTQTIGDNSTKVATTAYVDAAITAEDLDFSGDTGTGSVDLDSQILNIIGTTNEIETAASGQTLTIGLPDDVSITGELTVLGTGQSSFAGQVTIPLNPVATTDAASKGYVDSQITAQDLDFTGDSGTGQVDLDSQALSVTGGAVITTTALNQNLNIVHDNVSRTDTTSTDSPAFGGTFTSVDSVSSSSQGHITAINVKTVTLPTPSDATITLDAGTLLNGGGDFTLNQALNETITFNHDSVSRTDTTSSTAPVFGGAFTAVDSVTSSTEGHITAINLKTVTIPTPTYPTVNNSLITISAGTNLNGGGTFTLNQSSPSTITVNLDTTITGLTSVTSTTFVGALQGNADTATALAASGNITLTGDTTSTGGPYTYTSGGNVAIATTIADTTVTGKLLTGVNLGTAQNIAATDTILEAFGYLQAQITQLPQGLVYQGTWNASTNTPTLTSGSGTTGHFYIVSVAGSTNLDGITDWQVGDWAIFIESGATDTWQKIDNTSAITGTGATNKLAKWTGPTTLSTGLVEDDGTTVTIGNSGDLDVTGDTDVTGDLAWGASLTDTTNTISITKFVDEADGITANDNDTSIPTSAAVKDYVDGQVTAQDLDFAGGTGIGTVDLDSQTFTIAGTTNEIETSASGQTLTIGLPNDVTIGNDLTVTTDLDVGGLITVGTNDTVLQNDKLIFKSTTGAAIGHNTAGTAIQFYTTTTTALDTLALTISGNDLTVSGELSVSGTGQSSFGGQVTIPATPVASTDAASKGYVDSQVAGSDTLSEVLANGNTTGGTDISVSAGDDITFTDSSIAYFGSGNDMLITHDGGNGIIRNSTGDFILQRGTTPRDLLKGTSGGVLELYYQGSKKLETTSTGITVTGATNRFTVDSGTASAIDIGYVSSARTIRAVETGGGNARPLTLLAQNFTFKDDSATRMEIDSNGRIYNYESLANGNTFYGFSAGIVTTTGTFNTSIGYNSGDNITTGSHNTNIGYNTGQAITTGYDNTSIGSAAGKGIVGGHSNTLIGRQSGKLLTSGTQNTFLGKGSGEAVTTGLSNTLIGTGAGDSYTTGGGNVVIGTNAGQTSTTTSQQTFIGRSAGYYHTGQDAVAVGYEALVGAPTSTGLRNTAIGAYAFRLLSTGQDNVAVGQTAGYALSSGNYNTFLGTKAGNRVTTGGLSVMIGYAAGEFVTTSSDLVAIGYAALGSTTTSVQNTAVGYLALHANTSGNYNSAIGYLAMRFNTTGAENHASGRLSLYANTTGSYNVAVGGSALESSTTGSYNTAVGSGSIYSKTTGDANTAVGYRTLYLLGAGGTGNTAIGQQALQNTTSDHNVAVGRHALIANTSGSANVAVGAFAGDSNTSGVYNTYIGYDAGQAANNNENVHIGFYAGRLSTGGENVIIGSQAVRLNNSSATNTVAIGRGAMYKLSSGNDNTAVGHQAGFEITTGTRNSLFGKGSGDAITTGSYNTMLGRMAGQDTVTGSYNTFVGELAGYQNTDSDNTALGWAAGYAMTSGTRNTAIGRSAMENGTGVTGDENTSVGHNSMNVLTSGYSNTAIGAYAGDALTSGQSNTAVGQRSLSSATASVGNTALGRAAMQVGVGSYNVAVGNDALENCNGSRNTAVGYAAGVAVTSAVDNVIVGENAANSLTTGSYNVIIGRFAGEAATSMSYATIIGRTAGRFHTSGAEPMYIGYDAGQQVTSGNYNTAIGTSAMTYGNGDDNTFVGFHAGFGQNLQSSSDNTAVGYYSMRTVSTGSYNTALGHVSLTGITTGIANVALGRSSLYTNTTGDYNVAVGMDALYYNTTAGYNTAIGASALQANTIGQNNVAIGYQAGDTITTGNHNAILGTQAAGASVNATGMTLIGHQAGYDHQADYQTAVGYQALYNTGTGAYGVAVGFRALYTLTSGAGNTAVGYSSLQDASTGAQNTALGTWSLENVTTATYNTAIGYQAGQSNATSSYNTFIGGLAGRDTTGENNTYVGAIAGRFSTVGNRNTVMGSQACDNHVMTSSDNTVMGFTAGQDLTSGGRNTLIGSNAGLNMTTATNNVISGYQACASTTTATSNVISGYQGGYSISTGFNNSGVGHANLYHATTGWNNVAMGINSGGNISSGYNNIAIGASAMGQGAPTSATTGNSNIGLGVSAAYELTSGSNNILIGTNAGRNASTTNSLGIVTTGSNEIQMGNTSHTAAYIQIGWTTVSDARDKTKIKELDKGLEFIEKLKPVSYEFKKERQSEEADGIERYGFLAQDVLELEGENPVIVDTNNEDKLKMTNDYLIPILVNSIKELQKEIVNLKSQINK